MKYKNPQRKKRVPTRSSAILVVIAALGMIGCTGMAVHNSQLSNENAALSSENARLKKESSEILTTAPYATDQTAHISSVISEGDTEPSSYMEEMAKKVSEAQKKMREILSPNASDGEIEAVIANQFGAFSEPVPSD